MTSAIERKAFSDADMLNASMAMPMMTDEAALEKAVAAPTKVNLDDIVGNLDEPFSTTLLRLIDATGKKDAEVYRRA